MLPEPWGTRALSLVRIPGTDGLVCNHLVVSQVHRHLMGDASPSTQLSDKTFRTALSQRKVSKASDKQLMARLRELGASAPQANNVSLAPVHSIQKALTRLHFTPDVIASFTPLVAMQPPPRPPPTMFCKGPLAAGSMPPSPPPPPMEGEWGDWGDAAGVGDDDEMDWEDEVEITRVVPPGARCRSPAIDLTYGE